MINYLQPSYDDDKENSESITINRRDVLYSYMELLVTLNSSRLRGGFPIPTGRTPEQKLSERSKILNMDTLVKALNPDYKIASDKGLTEMLQNTYAGTEHIFKLTPLLFEPSLKVYFPYVIYSYSYLFIIINFF